MTCKCEDIKKFIADSIYSIEESKSSMEWYRQNARHQHLKDVYKDFLNRLDGYESAYRNVLSFIKESEND